VRHGLLEAGQIRQLEGQLKEIMEAVGDPPVKGFELGHDEDFERLPKPKPRPKPRPRPRK